MATEQELERIVVRLTGDGSLYQKMLLQAQEQTKQAMSQIEQASSKIEGFYGSILGFAKTVVGSLAGFGVVQSLEGAFEKFSQMESTMMRLESSVKVNTEAVGEVTKDYVQFASQISSTTLTSKTTVLSMLQLAASMGVVGDKAKEAVQMSIALAGAKGGEASQYLRVSMALQQGHVHMLRHLLGMREEKDQSVILAAAQKMLASGYDIAGKEANTASGSIKMLQKSLGSLTQGMGELVAEQMKPLVEWTRKVVDAFNKLDPEIKKIVTKVIALAIALPLILPTLTSIKTVFLTLIGPITSGLTTIIGLLPLLFNPVGLTIAGITALGAAILYFTGTGGTAIEWLGNRFAMLSEDASIGINGIKTAIMAGDLELAFNIAWVQIQITFLKATEEIQYGWAVMVMGLKIAWADYSAYIQAEIAVITSVFWLIVNVVGIVINHVIGLFKSGWNFVTTVTQIAVDVVIDQFNSLPGFIRAIIDWFGSAWASSMTGLFNAVKNTLSLVYDLFVANLKGIATAFGIGFGVLIFLFRPVVDAMIGQFKVFYDFIVGAFKGLYKALGIDDLLDKVSTEFNNSITDLKEKLNDINKERLASLNAAAAGPDKATEEMKKKMQELEKERLRLIQLAADKLKNLPPPKPYKAPEIPKLPDQEAKVHLKFEAAAFGSAEALSRIAEFKERMGIGVNANLNLEPKPDIQKPSLLNNQAVDFNDIKLQLPDELRQALDRQSNLLEEIKNKPSIIGAPIGLV